MVNTGIAMCVEESLNDAPLYEVLVKEIETALYENDFVFLRSSDRDLPVMKMMDFTFNVYAYAVGWIMF